MLNDLLKDILIISVSGSIIAIFLLILKPFIQNRFNAGWYYYVWLIVAVRLIVPYGLPTSIISNTINSIKSHTAAIDSNAPVAPAFPTDIMNAENIDLPSNIETLSDTEAPSQLGTSGMEISNSEPDAAPTEQKASMDYRMGLPFIGVLRQNFARFWQDFGASSLPEIFSLFEMGLVWLIICVVLFARKLICYCNYVKLIRSGSKSVNDDVILDIGYDACRLLGIKKEIPVLYNETVYSPMLIGFLRPVIVLPDVQMQNLTHLKYIFMHELTHYKRFDIYYKWLIQIILCVHWFNPILYFAGKEINKSCELSCDEAVMKPLTSKEQRAYGDTLLHSFEMTSRYNNPVVSLTLTENSRFMKKRLGAIMKFRKKSKFSICVSAFLTIILCSGAMFTGTTRQNPARLWQDSGADFVPEISNMAETEKLSKKTEVETINTVKPLPVSTDIYQNTQSVSQSILQSPEKSEIRIDKPSVTGKSEIRIDIPSVTGNTFVKDYGKVSLTKDEQISAIINWKGDGAVMFLYTKEDFSTTDVIRLVDRGILPLDANNKTFKGLDNVPSLSSNFTYVQNDKELKLNFTTTPNKPIQWSNQIPETGEYNIYVIATGDTGMTDINGKITFTVQVTELKGNTSESGIPSVWMPSRLTKDQLPNNLKSWIEECDKKKDIYATSKNGMWYVYCNLVPNDYALEIDNVSEPGIIINISDIAGKGDGYALLSVPSHYGSIQALYNKDKKVQFTEDGSDAADFDNDSTILDYYNKNECIADNFIQDTNGYEASLNFINFSGSKVIYELDYPQAVKAGFSISADVSGDYKIALIAENDDIILKASSYFDISASKPIEIPKGITKVVLVGEQATGICNISLEVESESVVLNLKNKNTYNISESGSFYADDGQTLTLIIESTIKGGTVDLFLFDPSGKEQRITIGSSGLTKEIKLTKGLWQYNCSGIFKNGGNLRITGVLSK